MFDSAIDWIKKHPLLAFALIFAVWWFWWGRYTWTVNIFDDAAANAERFDTCLQSKQIYLNSCDETQPTSHADVIIQKQFGKLYIKINANLPYAEGGVFHTVWGAYHAFLVSSSDGESINIGSLVRHGDHWYKLANELLGQYDKFDRIDVYRQTEDYPPKRVLTGSIVSQNCTSL